MSRSSRLIIFDLDGVLVDACGWHKDALNEALQEVAGFQISQDDHESTYNGLPTRTKLKMLTDKGLVTEDLHDAVYEAKQRKTIEIIKNTSKKSQEKIDMICRLKEDGYWVACYTNSIRETAELMLESIGVLDHLHALITNQDVEAPKPSPAGYKKLMNRFSVPSDRTIIVEDSIRGLEAAWSTGAQVIKVPMNKDSQPIVSQVNYEFVTSNLDDNFLGHYSDWRHKRISKLVDLMGGEEWFKGKTVLELGCGYGHIGRYLQSLGATVTFAEGRKEYLDKIKYFSRDDSRVIHIDNEEEWNLDETFDLIIHWGLLYHLKAWKEDLTRTIARGKIVCLDTVVYDSDTEYVYHKDELGYDQALLGVGSNPSPVSIENVLDQLGVEYTRHDCETMDSNIHEYSWASGTRKRWHCALRRFWLIKKGEANDV